MDLLLPNAEIRQVCVQLGTRLRKLRHNLAHQVKLLRFGVGKRAKQGAVHYREDGGIGADAEGKRDDGDGREAGRLAEHARGEAEVLEGGLEERQPPAFAVDLLGLLEATEAKEGLATRLLQAHSLTEVPFDRHVYVRAQLRVEVAVEAAPAKQRQEARGQRTKRFGHEVALSTRLITATIWFQPAASSRSCLRPLRVSE